MLRKTTTAFALAGALMLVAGGCGSDEEAGANDKGAESTEEATPAAADATEQGGGAAGTADFCQKAKALYDQLATAAPAAPTSDQVKGVFEEAKALQAPAEIATDWNAILDTLVAPVVNGEIDVNTPAGTGELTERAAGLAESLQRTGTYFDTTCGFGGPATTAPADPAAATDPAAVTTVPAADAPVTTAAPAADAPATTAAPQG